LIEREAFRSFRSSRNQMSGGRRPYPESRLLGRIARAAVL